MSNNIINTGFFMTFSYIHDVFDHICHHHPQYALLSPPTSADHLSLTMSAPFLFYFHSWSLFCLCFS